MKVDMVGPEAGHVIGLELTVNVLFFLFVCFFFHKSISCLYVVLSVDMLMVQTPKLVR